MIRFKSFFQFINLIFIQRKISYIKSFQVIEFDNISNKCDISQTNVQIRFH